MSFPGSIHPIVAAVATMEAACKDVADLDPMFMSTGAKAEVMDRLVSIQSRITELLARVMVEADDVAAEAGDRDVAGWLHRTTHTSTTLARRLQHLARELHHDYRHLADALRSGCVTTEQAEVIRRALGDLPDTVDAPTRDRAETTLIGFAERFDSHDLRRLGRHILEVVDPDSSEAHEAQVLAEMEREAAERTRLTLKPQGDGTTRISGLLPDPVATRLATYLHAFTNPRRADGSDELARDAVKDPLRRLPYPKRLGEAFCSLLESLDPSRLPVHGGDATTLVVTISLEDLRNELGVAGVLGTPDGGIDEISARQARRLACNAGIVPAVLGGAGQVLDLGRSQRLFTAAQRKALLLRDPTCRAEGCSIAGTWSEAHHWLPWSHGGRSDLTNAVLLCSRHHHRAHDAGYRAERLANGDVRFTRRR